ncbi:MAG: DUF4352 domain-containing protein [Desulfurococcaceae archaeon]
MRAVEPVLATVIIVAITITIAVVIALWISGIIGGFTRIERLDIVSGYISETDNGLMVTLIVKNTGTIDVTIEKILINNRLINLDKANLMIDNEPSKLPYRIRVGENVTLVFDLLGALEGTGVNVMSGQMIEVRLRTSSGNDYLKLMFLPYR